MCFGLWYASHKQRNMNIPHTAFSITFHATTGTICIICEFATTPNAKIPQKQFTSIDFRYLLLFFLFCCCFDDMHCIATTISKCVLCYFADSIFHCIEIQIINQYELWPGRYSNLERWHCFVSLSHSILVFSKTICHSSLLSARENVLQHSDCIILHVHHKHLVTDMLSELVSWCDEGQIPKYMESNCYILVMNT